MGAPKGHKIHKSSNPSNDFPGVFALSSREGAYLVGKVPSFFFTMNPVSKPGGPKDNYFSI